MKIFVDEKLKAVVRDAETGEIIKTVHKKRDDAILDCGDTLIAQYINREDPSVLSYCAVGSDGSAVDASVDTGLGSEIGRLSVTDKTRSGNEILFSTFFSTADCNGTWGEMGLVNASSGGTFLNRDLFSSTISKDSSKTVTVDYTLTVTSE